MVSSKRRLKAQQEDLEEEWELIRTTLQRLRKALAKENDVLTQIKYEEEIKEREEKLEELEAELSLIEEQLENPDRKTQQQSSKIGFESLFTTLMRLGFSEQERVFEKVVEKEHEGAFLIQGKNKQYGQKWLAHRLSLSYYIHENFRNYYISIDLDRRSLATNMTGIWEEFALSLCPEENYQPEDIIKNIFKLLQSQNVVICFDNVDESVEDNLLGLIDSFWYKLAKKTRDNNLLHSPYKLLVFFIDYQGTVNAWKIDWRTDYQQNLQNNNLFNLPEIRPLSSEIIRNWIEQQRDRLPKTFYLHKEENIARLQQSKGIPELTIRKIFALCKGNWSEIQANLLKRKNE
jgi:hypothetical protein